MDETYNIQTIVLDKRPFREVDLQVDVFSQQKGRMSLIARGARKTNSKLAGHLEPLNLSKIMVVRGRQLNYAGGVSSDYCFPGIKSDIDKSIIAGEAMKFFSNLIREEEAESAPILFLVLLDFLQALEKEKSSEEILLEIFKFKLLSSLGYGAIPDYCSKCKNKLEDNKVYFSFLKRSFLCTTCANKKDLLISSDLLGVFNDKSGDVYNVSAQIKNIKDLIKINESLAFDL